MSALTICHWSRHFLRLLGLLVLATLLDPNPVRAEPCPPYVASAVPEVTCHLVPVGAAQIHAYRVPARHPGTVKHPILVLPGGPATKVSLALAGVLASPTLTALRKEHELILLDSRGVSPSRPGMTCPTLFSWRAPEPLDAGAVADCAQLGARLGWKLDTLRPSGAAADLVAVRAAFGIERWSVLALSWDARVAVQLARLEPERIAALLLHGPVAPDNAVYDARYAAQRALVLDRLMADCAAQPKCAAAYPGLGAALDNTLAMLQTAPRVVDLPKGDGTRISFSLTADAAVAALLGQAATISLPTIPRIAHSMIQVLAADAALPDSAAPLFGTRQPLLASVSVIPFAVQVCAAQRDTEPLEAIAARIGPRAGIWSDLKLLSVCPAFPVVAADPPARIPDSLPTLILLGRYDATVPEAPSLALAAAQPGNIRAVVLAATGHRIASDPCGAQLSAAFTTAPAAPLDTGCAQQPIEFVTTDNRMVP